MKPFIIVNLLLISLKLLANPSSYLRNYPYVEAKPFFIIHSSGPISTALRHAQILRNNLVRQGYPLAKIHILRYSYENHKDTIARNLNNQIEGYMRHYPEGTTFNISGHSFGQYVGLYTIVKFQKEYLVNVFVGLAGTGGGFSGKTRSPIIRKYLHLMNPTYNNSSDYIDLKNGPYADAISQIKKCSLFSSNDRLVSERRCSVFYDQNSLNLEVLRGQSSIMPTKIHLEVGSSMQSAVTILSSCLNGTWF